MTTSGPLPTVRRHPVVGALTGLVLGTAMALWLVLYGVVAIGTWPPVVLPFLVAGAGLVWGVWGPIRGGGPAATDPVPAYNERVQQALERNESVIGSSGQASSEVDGPLLPEIGPPAADEYADWRRRARGDGDPPTGNERS